MVIVRRMLALFCLVVQVPRSLSELRLVQLSDLTKREIIIGRLPLTVQTAVDEDWQSLYDAGGNPTKWHRQPFVLVVVVCASFPCHQEHPGPVTRQSCLSGTVCSIYCEQKCGKASPQEFWTVGTRR